MNSQRRRGLIPGGSEQLNRYRILRRHQQRVEKPKRHTERSAESEEDDSSNSDHSLDQDPDHEILNVVNHVRTFSSDLYLALREKHPTNLVYSPLGFCISAVLIQVGCVGAAKEELSRALFPKLSGEGDDTTDDQKSSEMIIGLSALLEFMNEKSNAFTFKHAHKIFMDVNHKPRKTYKNLMKTISCGGINIEELDFSNLGWELSTTKINRWAHEAGGRMLGEVLTKRSNGSPKMILVNPIYFTGNWIHPFNPALTKESKFFVSDRESVNAVMMKSGILKNLLYSPLNKLGCRALVLPYKGDRLGLVIFLPNEKSGLILMESNMEHISPATYLRDMHIFRRKMSSKSGIQVYLPKFKIDCTIDFQGPMKEMGIETAFHAGKADFSGLAHISAKNLHITEVLQKVVFEINEMGNETIPARFKTLEGEASSVDAAAKIGEDGYSEVIEFVVDHPFFFQLIDMKSDLILLAGTCKNPIHGNNLGLGYKEFLQKYDIEVISKQPQSAGQVKTYKAQVP